VRQGREPHPEHEEKAEMQERVLHHSLRGDGSRGWNGVTLHEDLTKNIRGVEQLPPAQIHGKVPRGNDQRSNQAGKQSFTKIRMVLVGHRRLQRRDSAQKLR
jgi:hypothetical protein